MNNYDAVMDALRKKTLSGFLFYKGRRGIGLFESQYRPLYSWIRGFADHGSDGIIRRIKQPQHGV